ncbi:hypothetical protein QBC33DRAFT_202718 [Phialemonium atrogriseum]|uniref:Uncharacterized protein n=1 Tax=Phialemonium atrogriseum TaxID=1093897 RepID=A0AAJ0BTN6_9PEZI|nr:uncharacterized protein QBC33DRAFT_202718 [Phialemonium atrogriseum]KAK1764289.1 hypothetical protein QBC33DRAFT_202718 [Phialemonium atrogriseum]
MFPIYLYLLIFAGSGSLFLALLRLIMVLELDGESPTSTASPLERMAVPADPVRISTRMSRGDCPPIRVSSFAIDGSDTWWSSCINSNTCVFTPPPRLEAGHFRIPVTSPACLHWDCNLRHNLLRHSLLQQSPV